MVLRGLRVAAFASVVLALAAMGNAAAQDQVAPGLSAADVDRNSPPYLTSVESRVTVRPDLTAVTIATVRLKILRDSAIRSLGQRSLTSHESTYPLELIEAFTEKSNGTKVAVDEAQIITRDAATGLNAVYQRDTKSKTLIFPDIEVGDHPCLHVPGQQDRQQVSRAFLLERDAAPGDPVRHLPSHGRRAESRRAQDSCQGRRLELRDR